MDYAIVQFTEEDNSYGVVSTNWIFNAGTYCFYPKAYSDIKKNKLLRERVAPIKGWLKRRIRVLKTYASYQNAKHHEYEAQHTFNLDSGKELPPKKRRREEKIIEHPEKGSGGIDNPVPSTILTRYNVPPTSSSCSTTTTHAQTTYYPTSPNDLIPLSIENFASMEPQKTMLQIINDLTKAISIVERKMDKILLHFDTSNKKEKSSSLFGLMPLGINEFLNLNKNLETNLILRQQIKDYMLSCHGNDCKAFVSNILRNLITNEVGIDYNLTGRSKGKSKEFKKSFENTYIYKMIREVCCQSYYSFKDNMLREAVSDWLLQAKFRKMRRDKRAEKILEAERTESYQNV